MSPAPSLLPTPTAAPPEQQLEKIPTLSRKTPDLGKFLISSSSIRCLLELESSFSHEFFQGCSRSSALNSCGVDVLVSPTPFRFLSSWKLTPAGIFSVSKEVHPELTAQGINLTGNDQTPQERKIFQHNSWSLFPSGCKGLLVFSEELI